MNLPAIFEVLAPGVSRSCDQNEDSKAELPDNRRPKIFAKVIWQAVQGCIAGGNVAVESHLGRFHAKKLGKGRIYYDHPRLVRSRSKQEI